MDAKFLIIIEGCLNIPNMTFWNSLSIIVSFRQKNTVYDVCVKNGDNLRKMLSHRYDVKQNVL